MTATTLASSPIAAAVYVSTTGTSDWTDISGMATSVSFGGGELQTGEAFTIGGTVPIITAGPNSMVECTINALYSHGTAAPDYLGTIETWKKNRTKAYVKVAPEGTATWSYISAGGYFVSPIAPDLDASSADPLAVEITFRAPEFLRATTG